MLVPLNLKGDSEEVAWENPRPSSTRLCRPVKFEFVKGSEDVIRESVQETKEKIASLVPTEDRRADVLCGSPFAVINGRRQSRASPLQRELDGSLPHMQGASVPDEQLGCHWIEAYLEGMHEASNKVWKECRYRHTGKFSSLMTNRDVTNKMLESSDELWTSM